MFIIILWIIIYTHKSHFQEAFIWYTIHSSVICLLTCAPPEKTFLRTPVFPQKKPGVKGLKRRIFSTHLYLSKQDSFSFQWHLEQSICLVFSLGLLAKWKLGYRKSRILQRSAHILGEDTWNYRCIRFSKNSKKVDSEVGCPQPWNEHTHEI